MGLCEIRDGRAQPQAHYWVHPPRFLFPFPVLAISSIRLSSELYSCFRSSTTPSSRILILSTYLYVSTC
jgi:hypothetical protein